MRKLIIATIMVVGLFGCTTWEMRNKQAQADFAWVEMCDLLEDKAKYQCMRLKQPVIVFEEMPEGTLGYYLGEEFLYVSDALRGEEIIEIIMHEGIHYVHKQHQIINIPGYAKEVCWSENEAWGLTGIYFRDDNSKWWKAYPYCWQYYADSKYLKDVGELYNRLSDIMNGITFEDGEVSPITVIETSRVLFEE